MKKLNTIIRVILGIAIIISGVNKFGNWIDVSFMQDALAFIADLSNIGGGFIVTGIALIEISLGILLLVNKYSTFAALALLPLMVAILFFHIVLDLNGILVAIVVFTMNVYLVLNRKDQVAPIFS